MSSSEYVQYVTKRIINYLENGRNPQPKENESKWIQWFGLAGFAISFWKWKKKHPKL